MAEADLGEIVVEKLIPDGKALGRLADGRVVILTGAMPGDRVELTEFSATKGLIKARAFRLLVPSALRIKARCPIAEQCGGCDWMVLDAERQRESKLALLHEALLRTGKLDPSSFPISLFSGRLRDGYRGRVRLQVGDDRIGFFFRGTHRLIEPEHCAVSSPLVNAALAELRRTARAFPDALSCFSWLELRQGSEGSVSIQLQRNDKPLSATAERWLGTLRAQFIVVTDLPEAREPTTWQRFQLTDETYMLASPANFTQVNWEVNRELIGRVLDGAIRRGVRSFLDAYAGSGNFALPLLARGLSGLAIESNDTAVLAAREAARQQGLPASFMSADVAVAVRDLWRQERRFDLVLVDPPRAGVKTGLPELARLASGWLCMCSCNPVTLARDLRSLIDLGYELEQLEAFDMFPQTHHLETLAWLRAPTLTP